MSGRIALSLLLLGLNLSGWFAWSSGWLDTFLLLLLSGALVVWGGLNFWAWRQKLRQWSALVHLSAWGVFLISLALGAYGAFTRPLHADEQLLLRQVSPLVDAGCGIPSVCGAGLGWQCAATIQQPPLNFYLLKWSVATFGVNPMGVRLPSIFSVALSVSLLFLLSFGLFRSLALSILAAVFFLCFPELLALQQQARPYGLGILGSTIFLLSLLGFPYLSRQKKSWVAITSLAASSLICLFSVGVQPFLLLGAIFLFVPILSSRFVGEIRFTIALLLVALLPYQAIIYSSSTGFAVASPGLWDLVQGLGGLISPFARLEICPVVVGLGCLILSLTARERRSLSGRILWFSFLVSVLFLVVLSFLFVEIFHWRLFYRYWSLLIPLLALGGAAGVRLTQARWKRLERSSQHRSLMAMLSSAVFLFLVSSGHLAGVVRGAPLFFTDYYAGGADGANGGQVFFETLAQQARNQDLILVLDPRDAHTIALPRVIGAQVFLPGDRGTRLLELAPGAFCFPWNPLPMVEQIRRGDVKNFLLVAPRGEEWWRRWPLDRVAGVFSGKVEEREPGFYLRVAIPEGKNASQVLRELIPLIQDDTAGPERYLYLDWLDAEIAAADKDWPRLAEKLARLGQHKFSFNSYEALRFAALHEQVPARNSASTTSTKP